MERVYLEIINGIGESDTNNFKESFGVMFEIWKWQMSDNSSYANEDNLSIDYRKSLLMTPVKDFLNQEVNYCGTLNGKELTEIDFINTIIPQIEYQIQSIVIKKNDDKLNIIKQRQKRKFVEFLDKLNKRKDEYNNPSPVKVLSDYFHNLSNVDNFLNEFKEKFKIEKGNKIRALIEVMKENDVLKIPERQFRAFYDCLKDFMNRNIGEYSGINDKMPHINIIAGYEELIKPILDKYKKA
jgi:hypothetical protein